MLERSGFTGTEVLTGGSAGSEIGNAIILASRRRGLLGRPQDRLHIVFEGESPDAASEIAAALCAWPTPGNCEAE